MKPTSIITVLNRFFLTGLEKGIFEGVQTHVIDDTGRSLRISPSQRLGMIDGDGVTIDEYIGILDNNLYSAVFDNGSILYLECSFEEEKLHDHRYFFIPCPFSEETVRSKPSHFSLGEWLRGSAELEAISTFRSRGTFRFDCVRNAPPSADPHPVSHLTFASSDCRLPVRGPLQISAFLNFTFDNFFREYRPLWWSFAPYIKLSEEEITITSDEAAAFYLNWEPS